LTVPVFLVGAGPGDAALITLRGARLLRRADAVLYDDLANPALLALAPPAAERRYVGKRAGRHAAPQAAIHRWMIERARRGLCVVRLKGGDPAVFARADEELRALRRAGVEVALVPGVGAASAAAAALGVPLTARGVAAAVRLLSGPALLAAPPPPGRETLAIYMGLERMEAIVSALQAAGWPPRMPAAVVASAGLPRQMRVVAPLARLPLRSRRAGCAAPAMILVGGVVRAAAHAPAPLRRSPPRPAPPPGIGVMAHGSSLPGWQRSVDDLARALARGGRFVRPAFLPPVEPGLDAAVAAADAAGVHRLAVVPYFLAAGVHVQRDLPQLIAAARRRFPRCHLQLSPCLEGHPALLTAVLARADDAFPGNL
jgi:uroporphyrin-III C-methyltransferase